MRFSSSGGRNEGEYIRQSRNEGEFGDDLTNQILEKRGNIRFRRRLEADSSVVEETLRDSGEEKRKGHTDGRMKSAKIPLFTETTYFDERGTEGYGEGWMNGWMDRGGQIEVAGDGRTEREMNGLADRSFDQSIDPNNRLEGIRLT